MEPITHEDAFRFVTERAQEILNLELERSQLANRPFHPTPQREEDTLLDEETFFSDIYCRRRHLEDALLTTLELQPSCPVILLGDAGSGKTSIARYTLKRAKTRYGGLVLNISCSPEIVSRKHWKQARSDDQEQLEVMTEAIKNVLLTSARSLCPSLNISLKLTYQKMLVDEVIMARAHDLPGPLGDAISAAYEEYSAVHDKIPRDYTQLANWLRKNRTKHGLVYKLATNIYQEKDIATDLTAMVYAVKQCRARRVLIFIDNIEEFDNLEYLNTFFLAVRRLRAIVGDYGQLLIAMRPATSHGHMQISEATSSGLAPKVKRVNQTAIRIGYIPLEALTPYLPPAGSDTVDQGKSPSSGDSANLNQGMLDFKESEVSQSARLANNDIERAMLKKRFELALRRIISETNSHLGSQTTRETIPGLKFAKDRVEKLTNMLWSDEYACKVLYDLANQNLRTMLTITGNFLQHILDNHIEVLQGKWDSSMSGTRGESRSVLASLFYEFAGAQLKWKNGIGVSNLSAENMGRQNPASTKDIYDDMHCDLISIAAEFRTYGTWNALVSLLILRNLCVSELPSNYRSLKEIWASIQNAFGGVIGKNRFLQSFALISKVPDGLSLVETYFQYHLQNKEVSMDDHIRVLPRGTVLVSSLMFRSHYIVARFNSESGREGKLSISSTFERMSDNQAFRVLLFVRELADAELSFLREAARTRQNEKGESYSMSLMRVAKSYSDYHSPQKRSTMFASVALASMVSHWQANEAGPIVIQYGRRLQREISRDFKLALAGKAWYRESSVTEDLRSLAETNHGDSPKLI